MAPVNAGRDAAYKGYGTAGSPRRTQQAASRQDTLTKGGWEAWAGEEALDFCGTLLDDGSVEQTVDRLSPPLKILFVHSHKNLHRQNTPRRLPARNGRASGAHVI